MSDAGSAEGMFRSNRNRDDDRFVPGSYYTDGERLLRIVSVEARGGLRAVEDCGNLDLVLVSVDELDSIGLQPVARAGPPTGAHP